MSTGTYYLAFVPMTVITPRLTALALTIVQQTIHLLKCEASMQPPPPIPIPYDGYYSKTDRTGTVQKTIPSSQRPPPLP